MTLASFFVMTLLSWAQYKGADFSIGDLNPPSELRILLDGEQVFLTHRFLRDESNQFCRDDPKLGQLQEYCRTDYPGAWAQVRAKVQAGEVASEVQAEAAALVSAAWKVSGQQISQLRFSAGLRAKLEEIWPKLVPSVEVFTDRARKDGFNYNEWKVVLSHEMVAAGRPEFGLHATDLVMHHEFGHALVFLLNTGHSLSHCESLSDSQLRVCPFVREVLAVMLDEDRQLIRDWVACVDRRTVFGEWLSARARTPVSAQTRRMEAPTFSAVVNKRTESLADDWARKVLRSQGKQLREMDLWGLCRVPQGQDLLAEFRDEHPETVFRTQVLGEQGEESSPYWKSQCDSIL